MPEDTAGLPQSAGGEGALSLHEERAWPGRPAGRSHAGGVCEGRAERSRAEAGLDRAEPSLARAPAEQCRAGKDPCRDEPNRTEPSSAEPSRASAAQPPKPRRSAEPSRRRGRRGAGPGRAAGPSSPIPRCSPFAPSRSLPFAPRLPAQREHGGGGGGGEGLSSASARRPRR